jgi:hypothetical protein
MYVAVNEFVLYSSNLLGEHPLINKCFFQLF